MFTLDDETVVTSISELRNRIRDVMKQIESFKKVVVVRNNVPTAMILNVEEYKSLKSKLDELEDRYFGEIARGRLLDYDPAKAVDLNDLL